MKTLALKKISILAALIFMTFVIGSQQNTRADGAIYSLIKITLSYKPPPTHKFAADEPKPGKYEGFAFSYENDFQLDEKGKIVLYLPANTEFLKFDDRHYFLINQEKELRFDPSYILKTVVLRRTNIDIGNLIKISQKEMDIVHSQPFTACSSEFQYPSIESCASHFLLSFNPAIKKNRLNALARTIKTIEPNTPKGKKAIIDFKIKSLSDKLILCSHEEYCGPD